MRIKNSIIFATIYSIVGILIGIDIIYKMNESYHLFIIVLPIAFFITSIVLWKFLINKPTLIFKNESLQSKFIFTAFLIGIISHPISFLLMILLSNAIYWLPFINCYYLIIDPSIFNTIFSVQVLCSYLPFTLYVLI